MTGISGGPDPRWGPRTAQEQAEQVERERRAPRPDPPDARDARDARDAELSLTVLAIGGISLVVGVVLAFAVSPLVGLYVVPVLACSGLVAALSDPGYEGGEPDLTRRSLVLFCAAFGFGAVGLAAWLFTGPWSLLVAALVGAPLGALAGWLLGTALQALARAVRRVLGR